MAADENSKNIDAADKAYEAAADSVPVKAATLEKPVANAAKAEVAAAKSEPVASPKPAAPAAKAAKTAAKPVTGGAAAKSPVKKPLPIKSAAKVAKAKPSVAAPPAKVARQKPEKLAVTGAKTQATAPKIKTTKPKNNNTEPAFAGLFSTFMLKETTMDMSPDFSKFQETMTEAQAKAKAAFEKGTSMLGEAGDFAKGNVEAAMESSKILADGMQSLGSEIVAEGRTAFEAMSGDIKELAAAKSPTDFFKLQSEMMRKNFDSAVAYSSKNSETMLKLMSDVMAPISGRVSIAMDKVRSTSV